MSSNNITKLNNIKKNWIPRNVILGIWIKHSEYRGFSLTTISLIFPKYFIYIIQIMKWQRIHDIEALNWITKLKIFFEYSEGSAFEDDFLVWFNCVWPLGNFVSKLGNCKVVWKQTQSWVLCYHKTCNVHLQNVKEGYNFSFYYSRYPLNPVRPDVKS